MQEIKHANAEQSENMYMEEVFSVLNQMASVPEFVPVLSVIPEVWT